MPQSGKRDPRAGRHAGGRKRFSIKQATTGAAVMGATLAVTSVISRFIFHRDFAPVTSFGGFMTSVVSFALATIGVGLAAGVAALVISMVRRHRLGGESWPGAGDVSS